jgi:hypothetical protein
MLLRCRSCFAILVGKKGQSVNVKRRGKVDCDKGICCCCLSSLFVVLFFFLVLMLDSLRSLLVFILSDCLSRHDVDLYVSFGALC